MKLEREQIGFESTIKQLKDKIQQLETKGTMVEETVPELATEVVEIVKAAMSHVVEEVDEDECNKDSEIQRLNVELDKAHKKLEEIVEHEQQMQQQFDEEKIKLILEITNLNATV